MGRILAYLDVDGTVRVKGVVYPVQSDVDVRHRMQQLDQKGWRWRIHVVGERIRLTPGISSLTDRTELLFSSHFRLRRMLRL